MRGSQPHATGQYGVRRRIRELCSTPLVAAMAGILCLGGGFSLWALPGEASAQGNVTCSSASGTTKACSAGGIDGATSQDDCPGVNGAGAYFVINQLDGAADAPSSITVKFTDGSTAVYPLLTVEGNGHTAKYDGPAPSHVASATVTIYAGWGGEFVLSHYCGSVPTAPTSTTTSTSSTSTTTSTTTATTIPEKGPVTTAPTVPHEVSPGSNPTTTTLATSAPGTGVPVSGGTTTTTKPAAGALAFTGSNTARLAGIAVLMVLGGSLLVLAIRRRRLPTWRQ